jgi:hypothetical protein
MKHWYQAESADLVNCENKGVAIKPEYSFESHGIYSGSGLCIMAFFIYTILQINGIKTGIAMPLIV